MSSTNQAGSTNDLQRLLTLAASGNRAGLHQLLSAALPAGTNINGLLGLAGQGLLRQSLTPPAVVISTPGYEHLALAIAEASNGFFELGSVERKFHKDGRPWQRFETEIEGREVIVVGGWITDVELMNSYRTACNAVHWKASKLTVLIAHHGDARQERAQMDYESVDALYASRMFTSIPRAKDGNEVFLVDIHADAVTGFFQGAGMNATNIPALNFLIDKIVAERFGGQCVLAAPDAGRGKIVQKKAKQLKLHAAIASKDRDGAQTETQGLIGKVDGCDVLLSDDLAVSFGSAIGAGQLLREQGARRLGLACTHLVAPINPEHGESFVKDVAESGMFEFLYVTDSMPQARALAAKYPNFLFVEPLAPIVVPYLLG